MLQKISVPKECMKMKSFRFICAAAAFLAALVFTSARAATADYAKKLTMTVNPASVAYASSDVADVPVALCQFGHCHHQQFTDEGMDGADMARLSHDGQ